MELNGNVESLEVDLTRVDLNAAICSTFISWLPYQNDMT
jgi:hypothetical protein